MLGVESSSLPCSSKLSCSSFSSKELVTSFSSSISSFSSQPTAQVSRLHFASSIFSWMSGRLCRKRVLFAGEKSPYAQSSFVINLPHPEHYWKFARCRKLQSFLITPNTPVKFVMLNETWIEPLVLWAHLYKFGNVMEIFFFANLHKKCNLELFL